MAKKLVYKLCPRCELNYILEKEDLCPVCKAELKNGITNVDEDEEQDLCPICKVNYKPVDEEMCEECAAKKQAGLDDGMYDDSDQDENGDNVQSEYDNINDDFVDDDDEKVSLEELQEEEEQLEDELMDDNEEDE